MHNFRKINPKRKSIYTWRMIRQFSHSNITNIETAFVDLR